MSNIDILRRALYGDPPSASFQPEKTTMLTAFEGLVRSLDTVVGGIAAGNAVVHAAVSSLNADLDHAANTLGLVYNDADEDNNGIYVKVGASGTGSWTYTELLARGPVDPTLASDIADINALLAGNLTDIAGLAVTDGGIIVGNGTNFVLETGATLRSSLGLGASNAVSFASLTTSGDVRATVDVETARYFTIMDASFVTKLARIRRDGAGRLTFGNLVSSVLTDSLCIDTDGSVRAYTGLYEGATTGSRKRVFSPNNRQTYMDSVPDEDAIFQTNADQATIERPDDLEPVEITTTDPYYVSAGDMGRVIDVNVASANLDFNFLAKGQEITVVNRNATAANVYSGTELSWLGQGSNRMASFPQGVTTVRRVGTNLAVSSTGSVTYSSATPAARDLTLVTAGQSNSVYLFDNGGLKGLQDEWEALGNTRSFWAVTGGLGASALLKDNNATNYWWDQDLSAAGPRLDDLIDALDAIPADGPDLVDTANSVASWTPYGNNTVEQDGDAIKITYVDDTRGAYVPLSAAGGLTTNLTANRWYRVSGEAKVSSGGFFNLQVTLGAVTFQESITATDFIAFSGLFQADGSGELVRTNSLDAGEVAYVRGLVVEEVGQPDPTVLIWDQGEADKAGLADATITAAEYEAALEDVFDYIRGYDFSTGTRTSMDLSSLKIIIVPLGADDTAAIDGAAYVAIREAQHAVADAQANTHIGHEKYDLPRKFTDVHLTYKGTVESGKRLASVLDNVLNAESNDLGPEVTGVSFDGNEMEVTITSAVSMFRAGSGVSPGAPPIGFGARTTGNVIDATFATPVSYRWSGSATVATLTIEFEEDVSSGYQLAYPVGSMADVRKRRHVRQLFSPYLPLRSYGP